MFVHFCVSLRVFNGETEPCSVLASFVQLHLRAICTRLQHQPAIRRNLKQIRANNTFTFSGSARAYCRNAKHAHGSRLVRWAAVGVGPLFSGQSARGGRLCANLSRDAHHQHQHRHLIGTRRRTGPSWPAALEWRVGLARGERPQPDSANLSLLSGGWQACAP